VATYYVRHDGEILAANKASATSASSASTSLNITQHNACTFLPDDTIVISVNGGTYYDVGLAAPTAGTDGHQIVYEFDETVSFRGATLFDSGWSVSDGDVYEVAATTQVEDLHYDETQGALQVSAAACTATGHWYWESNVLYLYCSSGNPGTVYTTPGVEGSTVTYPINLNAYNTANGNGCDVRYATGSGIYVSGGGTGTRIGAIIRDLTIHEIKYGYGGADYGIRLQKAPYTLIQRCEVYHCGWNGMSLAALWGSGAHAVAGIVVEECVVHDNPHNGFDVQTAPDACTITDFTIRRCRAYNNGNTGIYFQNSETTGNGATECYVYNNISYNNSNNGIGLNAVLTTDTFDDSVVVGNTCYNNGGDGGWGQGIFVHGDDCVIKNNICYANNPGAASDFEIYVTGDRNVVDYNLAYNDSAPSGDLYHDDGTDYTHAEYQSFGQQIHGLCEDPKFTDPESGDFTLQSDSPCIGAGEDLGAPYNVAIMSGSSWPDSVTTGDRDDY